MPVAYLPGNRVLGGADGIGLIVGDSGRSGVCDYSPTLSHACMCDARIAPGDMFVQLAPLRCRALDHRPRQGVHLVAGVLKDIAQHPPQRLGALGNGSRYATVGGSSQPGAGPVRPRNRPQ